MTMEDLTGFSERFGLNSQLVRRERRARRKRLPYRRYVRSGRSRRSSPTLKMRRIAPAPTAKAIDALIKFYKTGEDADRRRTTSPGSRTRTLRSTRLTGSSRSTGPARYQRLVGVSGLFTSITRRLGRSRSLRPRPSGLKTGCPGTRSFASRTSEGSLPTRSRSSIETGDCGPVTPIGINLPNDQKIRETYGSKSVSLSNVIEGSDQVHADVVPQRVRLDARRGETHRNLGVAFAGTSREHARGHWPCVRQSSATN